MTLLPIDSQQKYHVNFDFVEAFSWDGEYGFDQQGKLATNIALEARGILTFNLTNKKEVLSFEISTLEYWDFISLLSRALNLLNYAEVEIEKERLTMEKQRLAMEKERMKWKG